MILPVFVTKETEADGEQTQHRDRQPHVPGHFVRFAAVMTMPVILVLGVFVVAVICFFRRAICRRKP